MARPAIDTSSDEIVLHHVGERTPPQRPRPRPDRRRSAPPRLRERAHGAGRDPVGAAGGTGRGAAEPTRPRVTAGMVSDVYKTLIDSGAFRAAKGSSEPDDDKPAPARQTQADDARG